MGSTPSTAHRLEISRALYLTAFDKNEQREVKSSNLLPLANYLSDKLSNKVISVLHSSSKCSFTLSKLRFFGLRAPKTNSCYTT